MAGDGLEVVDGQGPWAWLFPGTLGEGDKVPHLVPCSSLCIQRQLCWDPACGTWTSSPRGLNPSFHEAMECDHHRKGNRGKHLEDVGSSVDRGWRRAGSFTGSSSSNAPRCPAVSTVWGQHLGLGVPAGTQPVLARGACPPK